MQYPTTWHVLPALVVRILILRGVGAEPREVRLEKLKGMLDKGLITQVDFDNAKAEVLKRLVG